MLLHIIFEWSGFDSNSKRFKKIFWKCIWKIFTEKEKRKPYSLPPFLLSAQAAQSACGRFPSRAAHARALSFPLPPGSAHLGRNRCRPRPFPYCCR
jgi:hypothetical protein